MDDPSDRKTKAVQGFPDESGIGYLYSPELNSVETAWSKLKQYLSRRGAKTEKALNRFLKAGLNKITSTDSEKQLRRCGYLVQVRL